ncbi:hypothetical protein [Sphingomonas humi]|uniref:HK97 gp10 family phage protein n=1 Tax=Sphingomonas humi TaxID=335630 RepID=A0ABP7RYA2_9SPHN
MSFLKNLKLSNVAPIRFVDPKQHTRTRLLRYLNEQKALAQAEVEGRAYNATKVVFRTNEDGQRVRADAPRHVRRGWFQNGSSMFFQVRYGNKPLDLGKGMTAVEVSGVDAIPAIIDAVVEAVSAGELDEALAAAAVERRANFKRRNASK